MGGARGGQDMDTDRSSIRRKFELRWSGRYKPGHNGWETEISNKVTDDLWDDYIY